MGRNLFEKACAQLDVFDITLHDLRHCHGQWAIDAGAPERAVQRTLGQDDPAMTRRYVQTKEKGEVATALGVSMLEFRDEVLRADC